MRRIAIIAGLALLASACVPKADLKKSQAETDTFKTKSAGLETQLASRTTELASAQKDIEAFKQGKDAAARVETDLRSQLAASDEKLKAANSQIESLKGSVADLHKTLESSKGELTKKVASLVSEKDGLAQKLNEAQAATASLRASKDAQLADLTGKLNSTLEQKAALETAKAQAEAARLAAEKAKEDELAKAKKSYEDLEAGLKSEIQAGEVKVTQLQGRLTLQMVDKILFDSGSADIKSSGRKVLARLGKLLNDVPDKDLRIEGHTDNVPIKDELRAIYASNWELSTARATSVARYLQDAAKVDPSRLIAAGYGEYRPVAPNDKPETRALNRRIEIVLVAREK